MKVKNSVRRGLFHPDDIKTLDLSSSAPSSGPLSAPPHANLSRPPSSPSLSSLSISSGSGSARSTHSRSSAFGKSFTNGGSFGKADSKRLSTQEFGKYTESNEEDYEDVFGKPNGAGASLLRSSGNSFAHVCCRRSRRTSYADSPAEYPTIE